MNLFEIHKISYNQKFISDNRRNINYQKQKTERNIKYLINKLTKAPIFTIKLYILLYEVKGFDKFIFLIERKINMVYSSEY